MGVAFAYLDKRDFLARQIRIILDAVREELEEDMHLFDNPSGRLWLINFAKLMEWTATGNADLLPPELIPIAEAIEGHPLTGDEAQKRMADTLEKMREISDAH